MWNQLAHLGRCGRCRALARQLENNARVESELPRGAFRVSSALAAGVTRGQLRSRQLVSPFYGARASSTPEDTVARCRAYLPLLRPGSVFSHVTAAILWGCRYHSPSTTPLCMSPRPSVSALPRAEESEGTPQG